MAEKKHWRSVSARRLTDTPRIKHYQVVIGKRGYSVRFIFDGCAWRTEVYVLKSCGVVGNGSPRYVGIDPDGPTARRVVRALIFNRTMVWC